MIIDLHNHSYYSDGVLSPMQVVRLAKTQGCDVFALSDHDTTAGLVEARTEADAQGLAFVAGVEVSALWNGATIHILGLGVDANNSVLQAGLQRHQTFRRLRAQQMARGLAGAGVANALEKTQQMTHAPTHTPMLTRTHFAQMLIQTGVCKDMKAVFRRFLTHNKPGGVIAKWADFDEVIRWIHAADGICVLAHPLRYQMKNPKIKRLLASFANAGGDGVEVVGARSSAAEIQRVNQWARELNLLASVGSDYHGWANQSVQIGRLSALPEDANPVINRLFSTTQLKEYAR